MVQTTEVSRSDAASLLAQDLEGGAAERHHNILVCLNCFFLELFLFNMDERKNKAE